MKFQILNKSLKNLSSNTSLDPREVFNFKGLFSDTIDIGEDFIKYMLDKYADHAHLTELEVGTDLLSELLRLSGADDTTDREALTALTYAILNTPIFHFDKITRNIALGISVDQGLKDIGIANLEIPSKFLERLTENLNDPYIMEIIVNRHPDLIVKSCSDQQLMEFINHLIDMFRGKRSLNTLLNDLDIHKN